MSYRSPRLSVRRRTGDQSSCTYSPRTLLGASMDGSPSAWVKRVGMGNFDLSHVDWSLPGQQVARFGASWLKAKTPLTLIKKAPVTRADSTYSPNLRL